MKKYNIFVENDEEIYTQPRSSDVEISIKADAITSASATKEILKTLRSMPLDERMETLNTLREYLKQLEDENPKPVYYNSQINVE